MQTNLDLGADVDSRYVMVACAAGSFKPHRIANERKSIRAWLRTVPRGSRLAMESTGSYHGHSPTWRIKSGCKCSSSMHGICTATAKVLGGVARPTE
jgi:hypothetical protein